MIDEIQSASKKPKKATMRAKRSEEKRRKARSTLSRSDYEAPSKDKAKQAQSLKEQGFSVRKIAETMGISKSAVGRYLN